MFAKGEYTPSTNIIAALGGTSQGYETRQPEYQVGYPVEFDWDGWKDLSTCPLLLEY